MGLLQRRTRVDRVLKAVGGSTTTLSCWIGIDWHSPAEGRYVGARRCCCGDGGKRRGLGHAPTG